MAVDNKKLVYLIDPFWQGEGINGKPLVSGYMCVYHAGTNTPYITYQNFDGTRNPFKIPLNNDGRATILAEPYYKYDCYLYDSFGNLVCSRLNVMPQVGGDVSVSGFTEVWHDDTLSGEGTPQSPLTVIGGGGSGGKTYSGIDPIVVNNEEDKISANTVPFGVQEPLYFVEDETATIIGLSGNPSADAVNWVTAQEYLQRPDLIGYATKDFVEEEVSGKYDTSAFSTISGAFLTALPEGSMNESAFGYSGGLITSYNGSAFKAGDEFPQSATEAVELVTSNSASWNDVSGKLDESAFSSVSGDFYTTANPSGFITGVDLTPYQTTAGMTAYQPAGDYLTTGDSSNFYTTANESGFITGVDLTPYQKTADMTGYATKDDISGLTSADDWNSVVETVSSNSASWTGTGSCLWTANPDDSFMGGISGVSANNSALSMGTDNTATHSAIAIGLANNSAHNEAVAIGISNTAGWYGVSLGMKNFASTDGISIGTRNSGNAETYAIGYRNSGKPNAMMFGYMNTADGTAIGYRNNVTGGGVALAYQGRMSGNGLVLGKYNLRSADSILVIGNGTGDNARSDVLFIDNSGGLSALGKISANGVELGAGGGSYTGDVQIALDEVYSQSSIWNTVGDKLDTTATGNFYLTSNPSGFITDSDIANKLDTTAFSTVSGSFLTAIPSDVVTTGDLTASSNWDSTYNTVYTYSSTWTGGGTARPVLPISAGPGVKMDVVNDVLVFSNDETVLWTGTRYFTNSGTWQLSESINNFEYCLVALHGYNTGQRTSTLLSVDNGRVDGNLLVINWGISNDVARFNMCTFVINGTSASITYNRQVSLNFNSTITTANAGNANIYKIIGINRTASN